MEVRRKKNSKHALVVPHFLAFTRGINLLFVFLSFVCFEIIKDSPNFLHLFNYWDVFILQTAGFVGAV